MPNIQKKHPSHSSGGCVGHDDDVTAIIDWLGVIDIVDEVAVIDRVGVIDVDDK